AAERISAIPVLFDAARPGEPPCLDNPERSMRLCPVFPGSGRIPRRPITTGRTMHRYRTHTCGALREIDIGTTVRLAGWCHRIRDHGGVLFIDLRDHYGMTQVVADPDSPAFKDAEKLRSEWVVRMEGRVRRRPEGTDNPELPTGMVEVYVSRIEV